MRLKYGSISIAFIFVFTCTVNCCFAAIEFSNKLVKDAIYTYAYCLGQDIRLSEIQKKFPELKNQLAIARNLFNSSYGSSLQNIDKKMQEKFGEGWENLKQENAASRKENIPLDPSKEKALAFIEKVKMNSSGQMTSPVCETLLIFNPEYEEHPEKEFLDGFVTRYTSAGNPEANGVNFTLTYPKSWTATNGPRPSCVQRFVNSHRTGCVTLEVSNAPCKYQSQKNWHKAIDAIVASGDYSSFIPEGTPLISSNKVVIDGLPGICLHIEYNNPREKDLIDLNLIVYMLFYKDKTLVLNFMYDVNVDSDDIHHVNFEKQEKLIELIVNSFALTD